MVSTHKILLASISNFLSDLLRENTDFSDIILPDFNMKDVLLGFENFVSQNDDRTSNEILKLLLGKPQLQSIFFSCFLPFWILMSKAVPQKGVEAIQKVSVHIFLLLNVIEALF